MPANANPWGRAKRVTFPCGSTWVAAMQACKLAATCAHYDWSERRFTMGYQLHSVHSIATDDSHAYFVFVLGGTHGLVNSTQEWLDKNFSAIAAALGPEAVVVRGLSPGFESEVLGAYQKQIETRVLDSRLDEGAVSAIVGKLERKYHLRLAAPLLLVTDRNPHRLGPDDEGTVFYIIPVGGFPKTEVQAVVETILDCIAAGDFAQLGEWCHRRFGSARLNLIAAVNEIVELKPGVPGLRLNINAIIKRLLAKRAATD